MAGSARKKSWSRCCCLRGAATADSSKVTRSISRGMSSLTSSAEPPSACARGSLFWQFTHLHSQLTAHHKPSIGHLLLISPCAPRSLRPLLWSAFDSAWSVALAATRGQGAGLSMRVHLHASVQGTLPRKHSQYFFRQRDLRQWHPLTWAALPATCAHDRHHLTPSLVDIFTPGLVGAIHPATITWHHAVTRWLQ